MDKAELIALLAAAGVKPLMRQYRLAPILGLPTSKLASECHGYGYLTELDHGVYTREAVADWLLQRPRLLASVLERIG